MNRKDKVRSTALHLIKIHGIDHAPHMVDQFESMGVYDEDYATEVSIYINSLKKRRTPTTKYKKFHPYQTKVIE